MHHKGAEKAGRAFPFQGRAAPRRVDSEQDEAALPGAMLGRRFGQLRCGREMNEPVGGVLRRSAISTGGCGGVPLLAPAHVVDQRHRPQTIGKRVAMPKVLIEKSGRVATITLNEPEKRNQITEGTILAELLAALAEIDADPGVSVLILTGAGTAFCAGGDLKAMRDKSGTFGGAPLDVAEQYRIGVQRVPRALYHLDIPTIAAVNGPAIGAGCDLAFMCDLRVASTIAQFGEVFVNLGIISGDAGSWFLPRRIGYQAAAEMTFTGRLIGAEEALARGLVLKVAAPELLMREAKALADAIAAKPPRALRQAKRLMRAAEAMDLVNFLELAAANQALAHGTQDHLEAVQAFLEKRKPEFKGR